MFAGELQSGEVVGDRCVNTGEVEEVSNYSHQRKSKSRDCFPEYSYQNLPEGMSEFENHSISQESN